MDISVFAKPQYDKVNGQQYNNIVSFAGGNFTYSPSLASKRKPIISPSRSTSVARGWVDTTSTLQVKLATASNANISVIASEQSERGNPKLNTINAEKRMDCHESLCDSRKTRRSRSFFSNPQNKDIDCHENPCGLSRNDEYDTHPQTPLVLREGALSFPTSQSICHTEALAEVSQTKLNRDISVSTKPQYDNRDSFTHNDNVKKSPRKLALSLATATIILSIQALSAADFTGSMSASELQNRLQSDNDRTYNFGTKNAKLSVGAGTVSKTFTTSSSLNFLNTSASSTTFDFTGIGYSSLVLSGGSSIGGLILKGSFSGGVSVSGGASVGGEGIALSNTSNISSLTIGGAGSFVSKIRSSGTVNYNDQTKNATLTGFGKIGTLTVGTSGVFSPYLGSTYLRADITNLNIHSISLTINASSTDWNNVPRTDALKGQHITISNSTGAIGDRIKIGDGSIYLSIGPNAQAGSWYNYQYLVLTNDGNTYNPNYKIGYSSITAAPGVSIKEGETGFILEADVATSYGAGVYRSLALSYMRRQAMTQNILDTMTTKTFHSDRYYNQEVELRLIQYDMSRLTNRSSKFAKQTRKNQVKIDKMRDKLAKLTLEQSKGQNLDKGYNNFEVIDQLDVMFIPYTGRRDWRVFALPYAVHSFVDMGAKSSAIEYAGGALVGLQRNLKANGIIGAYMGYEFSHADTTLAGAPATVQTNSIQAGLNYFKTFAITSKIWEGFIKATIRGGADLPQFRFEAGGKTNKIDSDSKNSSVPLMYSIGAEVRGGFTFYYFKRNSYLSPEVGLSYDMLSAFAMKFMKPVIPIDGVDFMPLGANEYYNSIYWHLPQLSVAVRYYKMWGNKFRTNLKVGVKYNIINGKQASFRIGESEYFKNTGKITLPAVYGNLALDFIWMIKKNHELSFGYDGLFYASTFAKEKNTQGQSVKTDDWFNGVTTTLNLKYAYWFGGTDYVKDKEGNAVSRSALENSQKKSKPKKPKKSKKKIYYIDE